MTLKLVTLTIVNNVPLFPQDCLDVGVSYVARPACVDVMVPPQGSLQPQTIPFILLINIIKGHQPRFTSELHLLIITACRLWS